MARPPKYADSDVLDRATDLFWLHGADAVSIRDLEVALDLRAPSIYRRFHSKDELLAQCLDRYVDRVIGGRIRHFLDDTEDPLGGLRAFFTSALRPHPDEPLSRGCLLTATAGHSTAATPEIRDALHRGFEAIRAAFTTQLSRAVDAGQLSSKTDPEVTARALLLSFEGLLALARSGAPDLLAAIDATFDTLTPTS